MLHQVCKQEVLGGVGAKTGNLTEHNLIPPPTTTTTANLALLMIHTRKKGLLYSTKRFWWITSIIQAIISLTSKYKTSFFHVNALCIFEPIKNSLFNISSTRRMLFHEGIIQPHFYQGVLYKLR